MSVAKRPSFKKPSSSGATNSPEELFYALTGRAKTHGYLRGAQQDALRDYVKVAQHKDVAFELPTGSGKTMLGLLIAEWWRRKTSGRAAFLTLTNQLTAQVLDEASRLNLSVADLRGNRDRRSPTEEARFLDGSAIAISTYSNLFNVNPVIRDCEILVLDDAHGGGEYAASMWTVRVRQSELPSIYNALMGVLTPLMTESQIAETFDPSEFSRTVLVDAGVVSAAREHLTEVLDSLPSDTSARYAWSLVRPSFHATHIFVSRDSIAIRPYIAPAYDHAPFASANHRIYFSATLGDVEDLRRTYAISSLETVRAAQEQDGRRYVFVPGLAFSDDEVQEALASVWKRLDPKRAVAIAPSFSALSKLRAYLEGALGPRVTVLGAREIEEYLEAFTEADNALLALANRYDGLDLPDDDCRVLLLGGSPRATNELETNLSSTWKLGPALRWREATRLVQGMGRCTRSATDFAVILLLGESLVNAATNNSLLRLLPPTLQREIQWGRVQIKELGGSPQSLADMVVGLIEDVDYRSEADESIAEVNESKAKAADKGNVSVAAKEVAHSKAFWAGDFTRAQELAAEIVDSLSGDDWAGYRAWWLYLLSLAARHAGQPKAELDAIKRAKATSINAGWLDHLLRTRGAEKQSPRTSADELASIVGERIWTMLEELGWSGKRFGTYCATMIEQLGSFEHKVFHQGLEALGKLLGAQSTRPEGQGQPDVIWKLGDRIWVPFEAKTEKSKGGTGISKSDLLEARGHVDWVRFFETQGKKNVEIVPVMVASTSKIHQVGQPFKGAVFFLAHESVVEWANLVQAALIQLRTKYSGDDFATARETFVRDLERLGIDAGTTLAKVRQETL